MAQRFIWNQYFRRVNPHYIVLVGDVGTGKSTIVEKLTGQGGRSSHSSESFTRTSEAFNVPDGSLIVSDTPGSNSRKDKLQHNVWIAGALNFRPVSRIFIVVKAECRIDSVIDLIRRYADYFLELPMDVVGVLVTHMDTVSWMQDDFRSAVKEDLGIDPVVFSGKRTTGTTLLDNILQTCNERHDLTVDDENFLKLFKIHNHHRRILKHTSDEIEKFRAMKRSFDEERAAYGTKDQVDLIFEFQAYMRDEIVRAEKRMSQNNNFTFFGENAANEAGHVANMANQLRAILYEIRMECLNYQADQNQADPRRCPHCNAVWAKVEGCDGNTTCGNRPLGVSDIRSNEYAVLGTYNFRWLHGKLDILKRGEKKITPYGPSDRTGCGGGCGKSIKWSEMAKAVIPREFRETSQISTSDIRVLPPAATGFQRNLAQMITSAGSGMRLSTTQR